MESEKIIILGMCFSFCLYVFKILFKSKCKSCDLCFGCIKFDRDIESEIK